jgi:hypothetical protein
VLRRSLKVHDHDDNTANSTNSFLERRLALSKSIANIHILQRLYVPGSEPLDAIDTVLLADCPENIKLWLPSALPSTSRDTQCIEGLPELEYQLRYAQATDALHDIRRFCRLLQAFMVKMQSHITNPQGVATRTQGLFDRASVRTTQRTQIGLALRAFS